ncbi:MAG: hypothetical protein ABIR96_02870 [Bdellovibrionota bacterium]
MFTLKFSGFEPDTKLLDDIYISSNSVYNALPIDSDLNVTLTQSPQKDLFRCIVQFNSLWGHSEAHESWINPKQALHAALVSISDDIKALRTSIKSIVS